MQRGMVRFVCLKIVKDRMGRKILPREFRFISEPICGSVVQIHTTSVKTSWEKFVNRQKSGSNVNFLLRKWNCSSDLNGDRIPKRRSHSEKKIFLENGAQRKKHYLCEWSEMRASKKIFAQSSDIRIMTHEIKIICLIVMNKLMRSLKI